MQSSAVAPPLSAPLPPARETLPITQALPPLTGGALLDMVEHRAFLFFWQKADDLTSLINDRASNFGKDSYRIASIAATGYGLAALPVGVEHGWISRAEGTLRARRLLTFLVHDMPHQHGWFYHFVDRRTGARVWNCEVSSIDTALLVVGALVCGQYFSDPDIKALANRLYDRLDWTWMRTRAGRKPHSLLVAHGWKPEKGFLPNHWDTYSEGMLLYLLGLGAKRDPLPPASWQAWRRDVVTYDKWETLTGGPLFLHQMSQGFFDLRGRRDAAGWDYWVSSINATQMNRQYCWDRAHLRKGYGPNGWGLNAGDSPRGYRAYGGPGSVGEKEDGTLSPTGVLASLPLTPEISLAAAEDMYHRYGAKLWGRFGFSNAFNVSKGWFDDDVIGIDLGMALVAIENKRSGLFWKLLGSHPAIPRAYAAAGLHPTRERGNRPLHRPPPSPQKTQG